MQSAADKQMSPDRLSALVATAAVLQLSESMLPHPVPGLRLGLANIVSLIILFQYGFKPALAVTLLRTVVSSFILGSFLSPGFALSFTAGFAGITVAALCYRLSSYIPFLQLSPLGVSVIGAFVHNMTQLILAYFLFFNHPGLFVLVPWLALGSVIIGCISGSLATAVLNRLARGDGAVTEVEYDALSYENRIYHQADSFVHRWPPEVKIGIILATTLLTVFVENPVLYGSLFVIICLLIPMASLSYGQVFSVLGKLWGIILGVFLLPLFFNYGTQELVHTPWGPLHQEAVLSGVVFSSRIILLALLSNLVARTTTVESFTRGIRTFLRPLDFTGMKSDEIAETISSSLSALPRVWVEMRSLLKALLVGKPRNFQTMKDVAVQLFLHLFTSSRGASS